MGWNKETEYFSGQGVLLVGLRSATGKPMALRHVGNCPSLNINISQETLEHKESQSGNYSTDLSIVRSTDITVSAQLEDFNSKNLAMLLSSMARPVAAGNVVDATIYASTGAISALDHLKVSDVVVTAGGNTLVPFDESDDEAPYDFKVNTDAGSIEFSPQAKGLGLAVASFTSGTTTALAVANAPVTVGQAVSLGGLTGADAAQVNGKWFNVVSVTSSQVTIALDSTDLDVSAGAGATLGYDGFTVSVSYSHEAFTEVEALTRGKIETYWRFEGLNAADSEFSPVVVDMFKVSSKPLQDLSLISDQVQSSTLEASLLADNARAKPMEKSAYFSVRKIDKVA